MKKLIIFAHPNLSQSTVSATWLQYIRAKKDGDTTVHCLCEVLQNNAFDIDSERQLIRQYDKILIVFPLYCYNHPSILQKWLEDVLIGNTDRTLVNDLRLSKPKQLLLAVTANNQQQNYRRGGSASFPLETYLFGWIGLANYCNIDYKGCFDMYDAKNKTKEELVDECDKMLQKF